MFSVSTRFSVKLSTAVIMCLVGHRFWSSLHSLSVFACWLLSWNLRLLSC